MRFLHVHRVDRSNVGDIYCAPHQFFDFGEPDVVDILDLDGDLSNYDAILLGGGGLGARFFQKPLDRLARLASTYEMPVLVWGAGVDVAKHRNGTIIRPNQQIDLFGSYFDPFELRGVRAFKDPMPNGYEWVPCVSCMSEELETLRRSKPNKRVGYYLHKSIRGNVEIPKDASRESNRGSNLGQKLQFLADHEFIITNTYHGTYWATLLGRKVICVPFKSGLFSFKHRPTYASDWTITDELLETAVAYPEALEECRNVNLEFYSRLKKRFGR